VLEAATRAVSLTSGGILNPPPRLLVEDNGASHPLRESGGGLGMVFPLAKNALFFETYYTEPATYPQKAKIPETTTTLAGLR
jgi:hypothetical protein